MSPDIFCISRYPILQWAAIDGVGSQNNGAFLLNVGAPLNSELLVIVAHTPCCDNDFGRQEEVDAIMGFIRDAQMGETSIQLQNDTPIIIMGDMNLVGDQEVLETLLTGDIGFNNIYGPDFDPDWDGTALTDALPTTTNTAFTHTWDNPNGSFSPSRLDVIIYSDAILEATNAFNLSTETLTSDSLDVHNLNANDTPNASDHFPVVVDFRMAPPVAVIENNEMRDFWLAPIHPNPTDANINIAFTVANAGLIFYEIIDLNGQIIIPAKDFQAITGENALTVTVNAIPRGSYFVKITTKEGSFLRPFIKI